MNIGERIRGHREAAGMLQDDLAKALYVSRQTVSSWERNKTLPDIESLKRMAGAFGTTADALIGDDAPEIARRFDREARELLALEVAFYATFFLSRGIAPEAHEVLRPPEWHRQSVCRCRNQAPWAIRHPAHLVEVPVQKREY